QRRCTKQATIKFAGTGICAEPEPLDCAAISEVSNSLVICSSFCSDFEDQPVSGEALKRFIERMHQGIHMLFVMYTGQKSCASCSDIDSLEIEGSLQFLEESPWTAEVIFKPERRRIRLNSVAPWQNVESRESSVSQPSHSAALKELIQRR